MNCFRFVKKLGLEPRFLNSKTRVYYVMVKRKYPHCKPQNSSKDWKVTRGWESGFYPSKGRHTLPHFFGCCNTHHGGAHTGSQNIPSWHGMQDGWSFCEASSLRCWYQRCSQRVEVAIPCSTPGAALILYKCCFNPLRIRRGK